MSMYPSLEDMKATELIQAQLKAVASGNNSGGFNGYPPVEFSPSAPPAIGGGPAGSYPSLGDFMGLELSEQVLRLNMPEYLQPTAAPVVLRNNVGGSVIAPISGGSNNGSSSLVAKSMITHGVRRVMLRKNPKGKLGLRVRSMNTGVFVCLVSEGGPAAVGGLRFGDQILQIDGEDVAGKSVEKVHSIFKKKGPGNTFDLVVRDRPFERTVTLVRDSHGHIGFQFHDGQIKNIVKDSSAARNGLLTDHHLLEVNGKNVIGLKDKEITRVIGGQQGHALSVTIMPSFLYNHMIKQMDSSLFKKMDHSQQDL